MSTTPHQGPGPPGSKSFSSRPAVGGPGAKLMAVERGRTLVGRAGTSTHSSGVLPQGAQKGASAGPFVVQGVAPAGGLGAGPAAAAGARPGTRGIRTTVVAAAGHPRPTIAGVLLSTLRQEGVRGVYHGMGPSLYGILPYAGLKFYMYQALKGRFHSLFPERMTGAKNNRLPVPVMLAYGAVAGLVAQTLTYPLDVVRRRMQVRAHGVRCTSAHGCENGHDARRHTCVWGHAPTHRTGENCRKGRTWWTWCSALLSGFRLCSGASSAACTRHAHISCATHWVGCLGTTETAGARGKLGCSTHSGSSAQARTHPPAWADLRDLLPTAYQATGIMSHAPCGLCRSRTSSAWGGAVQVWHGVHMRCACCAQVEGMQQMAGSVPTHSPSYLLRSTPQALRCMVRREGVRSLYAGMSINYLKVSGFPLHHAGKMAQGACCKRLSVQNSY